jgi:hypothetical protein
MAAGLGLKVLRVVSAEEVAPEEGFGMHKKAAPAAPVGAITATPVEIGTIDVDVNVLVRVEVGQ